MQLNPTALIIPVFCFFVWLEYFISKRKGLDTYSQGSTLSNLQVGILERLTNLIAAGAFINLYYWLHAHYAVFQIDPSWWVWILLLLVTDFIWYWYHRLAHEWNVFWSVHIVHHQSEAFNFSVSARITLFQAVLRTSFWAIMPIIGFPPSMIAVMLVIHGAYPFFTHTQVVRKLGWIEYILVTPSHHRVHHACNTEYLDKNYGDIFIFWDKLFGTFQEEREDIEIQYGLTHEMKSYSLLWQHFHFTLELWSQLNRTKGWKSKWNLLFSSPARISPEIRNKLESKFHIRNNGRLPSSRLRSYVIAQTIFLLVALFFFILFEKNIPLQYALAFAFFAAISLVLNGAILEQNRWIFSLELARILGLVAIISYPYQFTTSLALVAFLLIASANFRWIKHKYIITVIRS